MRIRGADSVITLRDTMSKKSTKKSAPKAAKKSVSKKEITKAYTSGLSKLKSSDISKRVLRKVEDLGTVRFYERKRKHKGGWMYVDYKDPTSGKWVRNVAIRKSDYEFFKSYRSAYRSQMAKDVFQKSAAANFRTVMNIRGNKKTLSVTWLNKAAGLLKAMRRHETDPDFSPELRAELIKALAKGDWMRCKELYELWEQTKSNEEINDYFDYDETDFFEI